MSSENGNRPQIGPNLNKTYWMIYGEWKEINTPEQQSILTLDNPMLPPVGPTLQIVGINEVIDEHPLAFAVRMQPFRMGFTIKMALQIKKIQYDFVMDRALAAAAQAQQPQTGDHTL